MISGLLLSLCGSWLCPGTLHIHGRGAFSFLSARVARSPLSSDSVGGVELWDPHWKTPGDLGVEPEEEKDFSVGYDATESLLQSIHLLQGYWSLQHRNELKFQRIHRSHPGVGISRPFWSYYVVLWDGAAGQELRVYVYFQLLRPFCVRGYQ